MVLFIILFCLIVALGLGLAAALSDWRGLIIPNIYPAGILLAFVPAYAAFWFFAQGSDVFEGILSHLAGFGLVFLGSFALFSFNMFGAGDSKLCSAFAIWVGLKGLSAFIFYMAVIGGVLGLVTIMLKRHKPFPAAREGTWIARAQAGENSVPYGIAITGGALIAFVWLGFFSVDTLLALAGNPGD